MRRGLALLCMSLMVLPAMSAVQSTQVQDKLGLAVEKLEQGDTFGALLDLEQLLAADDEYWPAHVAHGRVLAAMGDDLGARGSFERAAQLDPGNAPVHFMTSVISLQLADFDVAWEHCVLAAQAGYERRAIDQLIARLGTYSDEPADLAVRLDAPRVLVTRAKDSTSSDPEQIEKLWFQLRTALLQAPLVALVQHPELARFEVSIAAGADDSALEITLLGRASSEPLYRGAIMVGGDTSDADAQLQVGDRVAEIADWLARQQGDSGS